MNNTCASPLWVHFPARPYIDLAEESVSRYTMTLWGPSVYSSILRGQLLSLYAGTYGPGTGVREMKAIGAPLISFSPLLCVLLRPSRPSGSTPV